jgi:hypothetical protein
MFDELVVLTPSTRVDIYSKLAGLSMNSLCEIVGEHDCSDDIFAESNESAMIR